MTTPAVDPENNLAALQAALAAERVARQGAEARASSAEAMVAYLKLLIAKMKHERFGQSAERGRQLLDQLELQLEELETTASEDECAAGQATPGSTTVHSFTRKKPVRAPLPAHLPRERVVVPAPSACSCCGGKLVKMGEDITETPGSGAAAMEGRADGARELHVPDLREDYPAAGALPCHRSGASRRKPVGDDPLRKFGEHQPLNRQSQSFAREGIDLDVSTLADWVGACTASLAPLTELIRRHVLAGERLHGDDTTVPVLAKNKTVTGRLWTYVRDDRPFAGPDPPAALFYYSRNRSGEHPQRHLAGYTGILQADAYAGFGNLYDARRDPGPVTEAACWSHGRRNLFAVAAAGKSPLAAEAVCRIDDIFAAERDINGCSAEQRLAVRKTRVAPLVGELEGWMRTERARMSRHAETAKAIDYMLKRWPAFTRFLDDGRICLSNNAAERALRCVALGRKSWLFAGSDRGGERAAAMYTLIGTAKLNGIDPQAWLADILRRIADHPVTRLHELLSWNWKKPVPQAAAA